MTRALVALMLLIPAAAQAQKTCTFDTAAHTDILTLEFSLRAFRGNDSLPDAALTRGFGDMMRPRFTAPASVGQLLYPNTYYPKLMPHGFEAIFGTLQFQLGVDGKITAQQWFAAGPDSATDDAFETALKLVAATEEPHDLVTTMGWTKPDLVRLQYLITQDSALHAPLARLRAPMVRVDSGGRFVPHVILVQRDPIADAKALVAPRTDAEFIVNEKGRPEKASIQIVFAASLKAAPGDLAAMLSYEWTPYRVGKCPVRLRVHLAQH